MQHIFNLFGIDRILRKIATKHPQLGFDLCQAVFTMIVCRFLRPSSKLKIFERWQDKLYPEMLAEKAELHHFYRSLDLLSHHKNQIEHELYWDNRDLLTLSVDVVLYDLTTLRFESTREDLGELRRFGYSKEMRSDCTQVILGLLVDTDGIPLGFEVYPGNTFEGHTLVDIVQRMRTKFNVRRFIFVADRGLFSAKNLDLIRTQCGHQRDGEFIVGMKLGQIRQRYDEFYDRSRFVKVSDDLEWYETKHGQDRCIITWSRARAERDKSTREDILAKLTKKIGKKKKPTPKDFVTNKNYTKYIAGLQDGVPQINEEAVAQEAFKDGFFGVITNVPADQMSASEVSATYHHLWIVEDAFGEIKGPLKTRPIYHWDDDRIRGHLTMCFLAYFCEAQMTKILREKKVILQSKAIDKRQISPRPLTVLEAMQELAEVRAMPIKLKGHLVWVRNDIKGNATQLLKALGVPIPPKLLKHTSGV